ncbi:MAG: tRNA pseudouridine(55) synthase TruB [Acidobacteria bacterium]|nr:tRNA pseudouridine(55) synthase TruB [Acidobacteriota bacterium]
MNGILIVDKPTGVSSNGVLSRLKRVLGRRKIGHAGTLDPLATGVLPVLVGTATRLSGFYLGKDKEYLASVRFGWSTDTWDADGQPDAAPRPAPADPERLFALARELAGRREIRVPAFSAAKWKGKPGYYYARRGLDCPEKVRTVEVYAVGDLHWASPVLTFRVHCSSGTYVRSLAHELGERSGSGAHLAALRRVRTGPFTLADAAALDAVEADPSLATRRLLPLESLLDEFPRLDCGEDDARRAAHGNPVAVAAPLPDGSRARLFDPDGRLVALGTVGARGDGTVVVHPDLVLGAPGPP